MIVSRQQAIAAGAVRYFTGKPCKRGHIVERTTRGAACVACQVLAVLSWQKRNPAKTKEWMVAWRDRYLRRHPEKRKLTTAEYRDRNADQISKASADYYERNRDRCAAANAAWRERNPSARSEWERARVARKLKAMPAWADREAIKKIYEEAARRTAVTGVKHSVDHFYPLQGKTVCGLHVANNLQVLTLAENLKKSRRMPP